MGEAKPFSITRQEVWEAYKQVKANKGAAGVDEESITDFEKRLKKNLYKIWNRMKSGSYFPPPVRMVKIPKANGGERKLGIPTVSDRIAQMVVKRRMEAEVDALFHPDSDGYRPWKSALEAVGQARQRCWRRDWVIDLDIKGFFDNIDHELLMRAVRKHAKEKWIGLYIERWLKVPEQDENGRLVPREKGTPQGGVVSPLLANLFLHYAFDRWITEKYPHVQFERYADDAIVHCRTESEAQELRTAIAARMEQCRLELHPQKTKIVYCKDDDRRRTYPNEKFDFLGYTFRPRRSKNWKGKFFISFSPAVSDKRDVVNCAKRIATSQMSVGVVDRANKDDRNEFAAGSLANQCCGFEAVHVRHADIQRRSAQIHVGEGGEELPFRSAPGLGSGPNQPGPPRAPAVYRFDRRLTGYWRVHRMRRCRFPQGH